MSQREILFKAKRIDNGEWVEGNLVKRVDPLLGIESFFILNQPDLCSLSCWHKVELKTVCQYTGLKDKNGVKIFEGDLCLCPYIDPIFLAPWSEENSEKCEIIFICGAFAVKYEEKSNVLLAKLSEKIEVVGNIHDN